MAIFIASLALEGSPADWGREALLMLRRDYYLPKYALYAEKADRKQPAYNWGVGVMLSALNAAAKFDATYKPWLREFSDATDRYWNDGGYDVLPGPKEKDRYYDDNAWMALALLETHEVLGDIKYLDWARRALDFSLSGMAKDGGVYWRESDRASRNTCACAPTATACFAIYERTKDPKLLDSGKKIFLWTQRHLRDPDTGLYWDSLSNSGKLDKTFWSYNTAVMIRARRGLSLLEPGSALEPAPIVPAAKRWLSGKGIDDYGRFAHLLFEALVWENGSRPEYLEALRSVHSARDSKGRYPAHWSQLKVPDNPEILDQAAFARACFVYANELKRK